MDDTISSPTAQQIRLTIPFAGPDAGQSGRLDKVLTELLGQEGIPLSRTRIKVLLAAGSISLVSPSGARTIRDANHQVKPGEKYEVTIPAPVAAKPEGQAIPLTIVFEDDHLIVVDKPAGLVVHPAAGNPDRTLVNALIAHCGDSLSGIGGEIRPGIVHRLDKETSGLLVVAKTDFAHRSLSEQFAAHGRDGRLERGYKAVIWGVPRQKEFTIEGNIGRSPSNRKKMAVVPEGGKHAKTHVLVEQTYQNLFSRVVCRLETGRTHQIRVHLAHNHHPLVGDPFYGRAKKAILQRTKGEQSALLTIARAFPRQALHAFLLGFEHPKNGEKLRFVSELHEDMANLLSGMMGQP